MFMSYYNIEDIHEIVFQAFIEVKFVKITCFYPEMI